MTGCLRPCPGGGAGYVSAAAWIAGRCCDDGPTARQGWGRWRRHLTSRSGCGCASFANGAGSPAGRGLPAALHVSVGAIKHYEHGRQFPMSAAAIAAAGAGAARQAGRAVRRRAARCSWSVRHALHPPPDMARRARLPGLRIRCEGFDIGRVYLNLRWRPLRLDDLHQWPRSQVNGMPISGSAATLDDAAANFKRSYGRMRGKAGLPKPQRR